MQIATYVIQNGELQDNYLHVPLFDVNIRLLKEEKDSLYSKLIQNVLSYMDWILNQTPTDYPRPKGISGANLGIPWNIIGYRTKTKNEFLINPTIVNHSTQVTKVVSNCGSLRLPTPMRVWRYNWVDVRFYTPSYDSKVGRFYQKDFGFTIQHEINHNKGILIINEAV